MTTKKLKIKSLCRHLAFFTPGSCNCSYTVETWNWLRFNRSSKSDLSMIWGAHLAMPWRSDPSRSRSLPWEASSYFLFPCPFRLPGIVAVMARTQSHKVLFPCASLSTFSMMLLHSVTASCQLWNQALIIEGNHTFYERGGAVRSCPPAQGLRLRLDHDELPPYPQDMNSWGAWCYLSQREK